MTKSDTPPPEVGPSMMPVMNEIPDGPPRAQRIPVGTYDVFICHADEDKDEVARPLAFALRELGLAVWYDEFELRIGDNLRRKIDEGIANSKFGVVILSEHFFAKQWSQYELDGMVAQHGVGAQNILPIWHLVTKEYITAQSPTLAGVVALDTRTRTIAEIAAEIARVIRGRA